MEDKVKDCLIELIGKYNHEFIVMEWLEENMCINSKGRSDYESILKKYGISRTNTRGFNEWKVE